VNVGKYTFAEFAGHTAAFHGYAAPGVLIGGYMVEAARKALPRGTLFEALVETHKCLPDAVQLLTPCSTGNNRLFVLPLGRYALSLFDKYTGEGARVHLDVEKLAEFPAIRAWFLKTTAKAEQDDRLLQEAIERAGEAVCSLTSIRIHEEYLRHESMGPVAICPCCGEAYPAKHGDACRGCRGEAPYDVLRTA
jgi:formylmethanofuran dehydrogenase subunit E